MSYQRVNIKITDSFITCSDHLVTQHYNAAVCPCYLILMLADVHRSNAWVFIRSIWRSIRHSQCILNAIISAKSIKSTKSLVQHDFNNHLNLTNPVWRSITWWTETVALSLNALLDWTFPRRTQGTKKCLNLRKDVYICRPFCIEAHIHIITMLSCHLMLK